ncbi:MAG: preprotein translocase subunit SecD [Elusimicrobia bacterium]|nr:MAG: preprotein translocase subunit SecD [Elusimicrobiota bacterium]KAF0156611.1 MAG: preprotein translocase subunit SecD [Elusimicrobiota bacterium]
MSKLQWRLGIILGLLILAVWLLYPTIEWYTKTPDERAKLEAVRLKPKHMLNLGLDLRGGTHMLLELDVEKLDKKETLQDAMARAIEIIRNRVDQYGVGEVPISRQGERWISVDLPGISNTEEAENLIGKTALLEFMLTNDGPEAMKVLEKVDALGESPLTRDGKLHPEIAKVMPKGLILAKASAGDDARQRYYVLESTVPLTGAHLENARVETDTQFGYPTIGFTFDKAGGQIFERFTGANVNRHLAIVLDGMVHSAPVIKSRIGGGSGVIEGNFTMQEARNLAIILRAGALPAPVNIIEKRVVGPSLGEDSIKKGLTASLIGFLFVFVFMLVYYRAGGFVAGVAMGLNFIFLVAAMSYFSATLTLPGIAGMILALAMAIDANVLILERMREEVALSKPLAMLIPTSYDKAWSAIFDSNVTTWIAAIFLFQFGSGPVKGFAVTLTIGLLMGVFTSVFVTRTIYDFWLTSNPKELSI